MTLTTVLQQWKKEGGLLTVKDAAELAGLTEWWVRQLITKGEIRAMNVGSHGKATRWRIDPENFNAWLMSRENRPRDLVAS